MEELTRLIVMHWPKIIQYGCMIVAYFLVFLFRGKINATRNNLTTSFKESISYMNDANKELKRGVTKELEESKNKYAAAVNKISGLENTVRKLEATLEALLGGNYVEQSTESETETVDR